MPDSNRVPFAMLLPPAPAKPLCNAKRSMPSDHWTSTGAGGRPFWGAAHSETHHRKTHASPPPPSPETAMKAV